MLAHVTITSQGQISIPAKFRKILGLTTQSKATIQLEGDKLIIKPSKNLMHLDGIIKDKAFKYSPEKIREIEKLAIEEAIMDKFTKK
jgi:AbrB family looped-hinge helix DNA binding protein